MNKEPSLDERNNNKKKAIHLHPALITGVVVTLATVYGLTVAYRNVPLVNAIMQTGVPVVYYGQAMVLLIGGAVGVGAALVAWYLGGTTRRDKRSPMRPTHALGYGTVGFLTVGVSALLMDPAAMTVGIGVIILWRILTSETSALTVEQQQQLAARRLQSRQGGSVRGRMPLELDE